MVLFGIDIGTKKTVVASPIKHILEIILNESSKRSTLSSIAYAGEDGVVIGVEAVQKCKRSPSSGVNEIMRLIGRRFIDPQLGEDSKYWGYKLTGDSVDSRRVAVEIEHMGKKLILAPEQILASYLRKIKEMSASYLKIKDITDCAIAVPCFFTESQRNAVRTAGRIAGLKVLRVVNQLTASALNFGITQPSVNNSKNIRKRVVFIDIGHGCTQACVAEVNAECMTMLSQRGTPYAGGRDMDRQIVEFYAEDIKKKFGRDINDPKNHRMVIRLFEAAERLKKTLTANKVAHYTVDCLANDQDYRMSLTREDFEKMIEPILRRMVQIVLDVIEDVQRRDAIEANKEAKNPQQKTPEEKVETTYRVELIGGIIRMPYVQQTLSEVVRANLPGFDRLFTTLNGDESVAKGCALICAMCSTIFRVRKYQLVDCQSHTINLHWNQDEKSWNRWVKIIEEDSVRTCDPTVFEEQFATEVFKAGERTSIKKTLTIDGKSTLISMRYADPSKTFFGQPVFINYVMAEVNPSIVKDEQYVQGDSAAKLKVKCIMDQDLHTVIDTNLLLKPVPEPEKPEKMDIDSEKADTTTTSTEVPAGNENKEDDDGVDGGKMDVDEDMKQEEPPKANDKNKKEKKKEAVPPKTKEKKAKKKSHVKVMIPVNIYRLNAMDSKQVESAIALENQMRQQDESIKMMAAARDRVEAYCYKARDALQDELKLFVKNDQRSKLLDTVNEGLYWLQDEDPDMPYSQKDLDARYDMLSKLMLPVWMRQHEHKARPVKIKEFKKRINDYDTMIKSPSKAYIEETQRNAVISKCQEMDTWLSNLIIKQDSLPPFEDAYLTCELIAQKLTALDSYCMPIINTPEPPPEKTETEEKKETEQPAKPEEKKDAPTPTEDPAGDASPAAVD